MAERQVSIESLRVSAVVLTNPTLNRRMFLSNLDLIWIPINKVHRLLFYKTSFKENEFSVLVEMFKMSMSLLLLDFYPLGAQLDIKGEEQSGQPKVDCNDVGVEFIEASIDMDFQDMENNQHDMETMVTEYCISLLLHGAVNLFPLV